MHDEDLYEAKAKKTVGVQNKRAVVSPGRFQPPTRGHFKMIGAMKAFIRDNPEMRLDKAIVVVIAGEKTGEDKVKNPLTAEQRKSYIEASGKANGVLVLTASNVFAAFEEVRKAGYEPIAVAAGSDRSPGYLKMLDKYYTAKDGSPIVHHVVPDLARDQDDSDDGDAYFDKVIDMINDGDKVDDAQISASLARYAARKGEDKAFAYIAGLEDKPKLALKIQANINSAGKVV
jgi:nicotinamide mononucleotide adenylyltransferase